ncbi:SDR family NAD(P)-dependent oxidoreductase [Amycolatopsis tucumanensis]|uniref:3-oxoacyl-ACP reductase FabG n=1 Tax=Amycolatopsis tucumanensis TaxID=401106 RepID=A0ABP7HJN9_9PSEU|nr:SDR family NAD(P)-dependent oxidoreductase [Amycolatopsis tucumanensis]MCF6423529.1 SDR family oxidoreductase [Amycolatopsis tucumanensis]
MTTALRPSQELIRLGGKTAIVTGCAVGIGYGIAARLADAGANVVIADVDEVQAKAAAEQLGAAGFPVTAVRADVADESDVARLADTAIGAYGAIDILVNNAGIYPNQLVMDMTAADFERVLRVNLHGLFLCTQHVARHMIERGRGGRIINITSIDALHPSTAGLAHYDASKHGAWGFTKNVALELAPHGIWVNAIAPGGIATPGVAAAQSAPPAGVDMAAMLEGFLARIPMKRLGDPDEIGRAALFLASELSSYTTGTQIVVDGGALLS